MLMPFLSFSRPGAQPFEPGERLESSEGENTGRRTIGPELGAAKRPSAQLPARNKQRSAVYMKFRRKRKVRAARLGLCCCLTGRISQCQSALRSMGGQSMSVAFVFP